MTDQTAFYALRLPQDLFTAVAHIRRDDNVSLCGRVLLGDMEASDGVTCRACITKAKLPESWILRHDPFQEGA